MPGSWSAPMATTPSWPEPSTRQRYHEKPVLENAFYTFWRDLPVDAFTTVIRGDRGFAAIPTNDDLTLVLVGCPFAQASEFRRDVEANYFEAIEREPEWADRLGAATREERFTGGGVPNFFRKPYGPGWALVGDAGYTKDPITAQGISDAFHAPTLRRRHSTTPSPATPISPQR